MSSATMPMARKLVGASQFVASSSPRRAQRLELHELKRRLDDIDRAKSHLGSSDVDDVDRSQATAHFNNEIIGGPTIPLDHPKIMIITLGHVLRYQESFIRSID